MTRGAWTVARKEMRETLRDWRTLLMMVGVPVLLYPALLVLSQQLALLGIRRVESQPARVAAVGAVDPGFVAFLERDERFAVQPRLGDAAAGASTSDEPAPIAALIEAGSRAVRRGQLEAVAVFGAAPDPEGTAPVTLLYDETRDRSQRAYGLLRSALEAWGDTVFARRLSQRGLPASFGTPMAVADSSLARPTDRGGYVLGRFLPVLLIVVTLLGAFYPAIDLAAGEKERGTLETLLTSPVPAIQIVVGKFATVALIALFAAALNVISMVLTFQTGLFQLDAEVPFEFTLSTAALGWVALVLVPLAALFAAIFLGIAVRSHSFKEAQNALTPAMMLALVPALLPVLPGIELTLGLALVPVAGPAVLLRDMLSGDASITRALIVLASTSVYAGLALAFAAEAFGREEVLFGGGSSEAPPPGSSWRERLRARRRAADTPTPGQALGLLAVVAVVNLFLAGRLAAGLGIVGGLLAAQWLLFLGPALLFLWVGGFDAGRTLSLRRPRARHLLGALLLIAGGTPVAWFLTWLQSFVVPIPDELVEALRRLVTAESPAEVAVLLGVVALTPAICEEFLFRGVLLGSSRGAMSAPRAILLNALVFSLFHLSVVRLLPTFWLGLLLSWVVWRTRSIWPAALMHAVNNGTVVILSALPATRGLADAGTSAPPLALAPLGLLCLYAGFRLLRDGEDVPT